MEFTKLSTTIRESRGKGAARRLRNKNLIPAICYGSNQPTLHLSINPDMLKRILSGPFGRNTMIALEIPGSEDKHVLVQDWQVHPIKRKLLHVDFLTVNIHDKVEVHVQVECLGRAVGLLKGGNLIQVFRALPIRCLPQDIPSKIQVDVTNLDMGHSLQVGSLTLPAGVEVLLDPHQTIVSVVQPKKEVEVVEAAPEAAEGAEGEAAAEGAEGEKAAAEGEKKSAEDEKKSAKDDKKSAKDDKKSSKERKE